MARRVFVFQVKGDKDFMKDNPPRGCSNLRILHEMTGMGYENLVRIFTRQRRGFYENGQVVIMKINERGIVRGRQGLSRRGLGGKKFTGSGSIIRGNY